jgi:hypothetical protein
LFGSARFRGIEVEMPVELGGVEPNWATPVESVASVVVATVAATVVSDGVGMLVLVVEGTVVEPEVVVVGNVVVDGSALVTDDVVLESWVADGWVVDGASVLVLLGSVVVVDLTPEPRGAVEHVSDAAGLVPGVSQLTIVHRPSSGLLPELSISSSVGPTAH